MTAERGPDISPDQEARIERMEDQGVWNHAMGTAALTGSLEPLDGESHPHRVFTAPRPHHNHQGGRSHEGIGGTDVSRMLANQDALENPIDRELQRETNKRGLARLEAMRRQLEIDTAMHRIDQRFDPLIESDRDNRETLLREKDLAINAAMRKIAEKHELIS